MSAPGVALAVTAGGAYGVYTLAAKRLLASGHAPESVMAVAFGIGALVLLPALLATQPTWLLHTDGIALALFLGIVPTALAYLLFASGLRRLTAAETSTLTLAEPLTAAVLGAVVLAEPLERARDRRRRARARRFGHARAEVTSGGSGCIARADPGMMG